MAVSPNNRQKKQNILSVKMGGLGLVLLSSFAAADVLHVPHIPLTPERIVMRVSPSVVEVDVVDTHGKSILQGSGVVVGTNQVVTDCHVVKELAKEGKSTLVRKSGSTFKATLQYADPDRDLCQLNVPHLRGTPITLGSAGKIRAGQHIHAISVSGGHELVLREGVVSNTRPHGGSQYMHVSVAVPSGSSGGALVDDRGRLIGLLSLQSLERQNFTFALPVEWIGELSKRAQPVQAITTITGLDWLNRAMALEKKADWQMLLRFAQQEVKRDPANAAAWYSVGVASTHLKQYTQAVHAYREAIRNQAEYDEAWHKLGVAYASLKEYDHAIHAYRDALRIQPENAEVWYDLGNTHYELKHYAHAIHAYREALRIHPENSGAWFNLGSTYDNLNLHGEAALAYQETVRIQPENADAWYNLGVNYALLNERGKMRGIYHALRKLDPARAERYFNTYILP